MVKIKNGSIVTIVHAAAYETIYKPNGWVIVDETVENELDKELRGKGLVNEKQQNAYIKAKHEKSRRHFNDGLFKEE